MAGSKRTLEISIWENSLFKDFEPALKAFVEKRKIRTLRRGELLFSQNQEVEGIYCHLAGLCKVSQKDPRGQTRFTRLVFPGDTSGHRSIFIENQYKGTCEVLSESAQVVFISKEEVGLIMGRSPAFARNLLRKISLELRNSEEELMATKTRTVRGRLAQLICSLSDNYSEEVPGRRFLIKTVITKRELAKLLLVANETVIRLMSEFKKEGLIQYRQKKILIEDLENLRRHSLL